MLNKVFIMGRLTNTPELKTTGSGVSVCSFSVACNRPKHGETQLTDFIDCVAWRGAAEFITKWFSKGDPIVIDGKLQTRTYEDKNGNKRKAVEVIVDEVHFSMGKGKEKSPEQDGGFADVPDEELPF